MFKSHSRTYLFGSGVLGGPQGEQSVEPFDPMIPATILRASTILAAVVGSDGLPIGPDYRLQVSQSTQTPSPGSHAAVPLVFYP